MQAPDFLPVQSTVEDFDVLEIFLFIIFPEMSQRIDFVSGVTSFFCNLQASATYFRKLIVLINDFVLQIWGYSSMVAIMSNFFLSWMNFRFQDISGLKFVLHRELEALDEGRKELLRRLSELGAKMENPSVNDAERAGNCSRCQPDMQGPSCAHCEAEELFQVIRWSDCAYC